MPPVIQLTQRWSNNYAAAPQKLLWVSTHFHMLYSPIVPLLQWHPVQCLISVCKSWHGCIERMIMHVFFFLSSVCHCDNWLCLKKILCSFLFLGLDCSSLLPNEGPKKLKQMFKTYILWTLTVRMLSQLWLKTWVEAFASIRLDVNLIKAQPKRRGPTGKGNCLIISCFIQCSMPYWKTNRILDMSWHPSRRPTGPKFLPFSGCNIFDNSSTSSCKLGKV